MKASDPILIIDDDEVDREAIVRSFDKADIKNPLYVSFDGVDAIEKLTGTNGQEKLDPMPKVILLDINMPRMTGLEFLDTLMKSDDLSNITVFMLTSSDSPEDIKAACESHVAGYILKPVEKSQLMQIISCLNVG